MPEQEALAPMQQEHINRGKMPEVVIHKDFPIISIPPENIALLLKSYRPRMSDKQLGKWKVEVKPFASVIEKEEQEGKKKHRRRIQRAHVDKWHKIITLYPDSIGSQYYKLAPNLRQKSQDLHLQATRRQRRKMQRVLTKELTQIPELGNTPEEHAKNIEYALNTFLYEATDWAFNGTKEEIRRLATFLAVLGVKSTISLALFAIHPLLALGVGLTVYPPITWQLIKTTERGQQMRSENRRDKRREQFQNIITINA